MNPNLEFEIIKTEYDIKDLEIVIIKWEHEIYWLKRELKSIIKEYPQHIIDSIGRETK